MNGDRPKAKDKIEHDLCWYHACHGYYKPAGRYKKAKQRLHRRDRRTHRLALTKEFTQ